MLALSGAGELCLDALPQWRRWLDRHDQPVQLAEPALPLPHLGGEVLVDEHERVGLCALFGIERAQHIFGSKAVAVFHGHDGVQGDRRRLLVHHAAQRGHIRRRLTYGPDDQNRIKTSNGARHDLPERREDLRRVLHRHGSAQVVVAVDDRIGQGLADRQLGEVRDVDLLAVFDETRRISLLDIAGMELDLSEMLGRKVDLIEEGTLKPRVQESVQAEVVRAF